MGRLTVTSGNSSWSINNSTRLRGKDILFSTNKLLDRNKKPSPYFQKPEEIGMIELFVLRYEQNVQIVIGWQAFNCSWFILGPILSRNKTFLSILNNLLIWVIMASINNARSPSFSRRISDRLFACRVQTFPSLLDSLHDYYLLRCSRPYSTSISKISVKSGF